MTITAPRLSGEAIPSARDAIAEIRAGHMSPLDAVEASIARIEATDGIVNAIPVRCFERARASARQAMEAHARGEDWPLLAGLPMAVKDNADVGGVPTSGGSAITAGRVPDRSDPAIALLERNGAIPIGKSNLSELGGANTTNTLFGATRNPFDPRLTAGGSSGGSAAALALGQVPLAHGNDVGGSLRTPAAFCGVAGLRPTPGLVPRKPMSDPFDTVFVEGPMARDVGDVALMLDAMTGFHAPDLMSRRTEGGFASAAARPAAPARLAVSSDLGILPLDADVRADFTRIASALFREIPHAEDAAPELAGAPDIIRTLRGIGYLATWGAWWPQDRALFTADVAGDIERGAGLTSRGLARAFAGRAALYRTMLAFFERFDVLVCPVAPVKPFPVEVPWPRSIGGSACESYIDWIMITYVWSILGCPALCVTLGRDAAGLPVAVQLVGPPHSEKRLLSAGAWMEAAIRI